MIIQKITLQNIKSYQHEEIDFTQGINCILGLNGSGKSTIIESIGLAIFNYCKSISQMLRYNESKGSIEVEFMARDDRKYRIVRTIRPKSNTVKIIDCEHDTELYSGTSDVYSYVKSILKIHRSKDLAKMFEEIIAVPQGQYVSAFLETASKRQANFDRLFDLHIYKELWNKLKEVNDYIDKNRLKAIRSKIDVLDGQLSNYDVVKEELKDVEEEVKQTALKKASTEKALDETKKEKEKLETIQHDIELRKTNHLLLENKQNNFVDTIKKNEAALDKSNEALKTTEKHKANYLLYQKNQQKINEEETKYEAFLRLENALKQANNDKNLLEKEGVFLQEKTDEKTKEKTTKKDIFQEKNKENLTQKSAFEESSNMFDELSKIWHELEVKTNEEKQNNQEKKQALNLIEIQFDNIKKYDDNFLSESDARLSNIALELERFSHIKKEIEGLEKTIVANKTNLEASIRYSQLTVDGTCPFLKSKCKNLDEGSLVDYFEEQIAQFSEDLKTAERRADKLKNEITDEDYYFVAQQSVTNQKQFFDEAQRQKEKLIQDIERLLASDTPALTSTNISEAIQIINQSIEETQQFITKDEEALKQKQKELAKLDNTISNLKVKMEMNSLRMKELDRDIDKIEREEKKLLFDQNKNNEAVIAIKKAIETKKSEYAKGQGIKTRLDQLKVDNKALEKDKDAYLAFIEIAKEAQALTEVLRYTEKQLEVIQAQIKENDEALTQLQSHFSVEALKDTIEKYTSLIAEVSSLKTTLSEKQMMAKKLHNEIMILDDLKKERQKWLDDLASLEKVVHFITKMRELVRGLPQQLSKTYREYISTEATHLYRRISNEQVQIELLEDYQVKLIQDSNEKATKTMEQLSGGEQMSVVIAIRLAMLKHLSGLDIYFLDEPTINLDVERRSRIADVVSEASEELSQLFVISHDDTFDSITDSVIHIQKISDISKSV